MMRKAMRVRVRARVRGRGQAHLDEEGDECLECLGREQHGDARAEVGLREGVAGQLARLLQRAQLLALVLVPLVVREPLDLRLPPRGRAGGG